MEGEGKKSTEPFFGRMWTAVMGVLAASVAVMLVSYYLLLQNKAEGDQEYSSYQYHIAMISDDTDTSFWKDVYRGAVEAGREYGAYVEQVGEGLAERFSVEDAVNMAIYEKADGILLRPSEGRGIKEMIDKACKQGIPVITMQKDVPGSRRQGFVGINDYFLGQKYGRQVLKIADEDTRLVTVLFPGASFNETAHNWFRLGLSNTVPSEKIRFDFRIIWNDRGLNNAEDVIHEIAEGTAEQPDVIICLDDIITQSVSRMIRDRGMADQIRLIGSYISDDILKGIEEGRIDSTITIDPAVMGRMSMDALMTYKKYHMVSYYTEVDTMLIDRKSASGYRREEAHGKETDTR